MRFEILLSASFTALAVAAPIDEGPEFIKREVSGPPSSQAGVGNVVKDIQLAAQDLAKLSTVVSANGGNDNVYTFVCLLSEI